MQIDEPIDTRANWQDQANCLGVDPDLFFPERGASTREAKEVCRGCVVRGDTRHFEHVADECARGLMTVQLTSGVPVANGVLAVERYEDAQARAGGALGNKGEEAALAALAMARLVAGFAR